MSEPAQRPQVYKTKQGTIRSQDLKAIQWYMIEHDVRPMATNVFPHFNFKSRHGIETTVHLGDIKAEYDEFKKQTHGKRASGA